MVVSADEERYGQRDVALGARIRLARVNCALRATGPGAGINQFCGAAIVASWQLSAVKQSPRRSSPLQSVRERAARTPRGTRRCAPNNGTSCGVALVPYLRCDYREVASSVRWLSVMSPSRRHSSPLLDFLPSPNAQDDTPYHATQLSLAPPVRSPCHTHTVSSSSSPARPSARATSRSRPAWPRTCPT